MLVESSRSVIERSCRWRLNARHDRSELADVFLVSEPEARVEATFVVASMSEVAAMRGAERLLKAVAQGHCEVLRIDLVVNLPPSKR